MRSTDDPAHKNHRQLRGEARCQSRQPVRVPVRIWLTLVAFSLCGESAWAATQVKPVAVSGDDGRQGFTELASNALGIGFQNLLRDDIVVRNVNMAIGSGIAAGDFDGDGLCDLYFCAIDGTNALLRNLGGWKFEDITRNSGVTQAHPHCTGAVFADLNGDAALDLLVSSLGGGVHSYLNDGAGHFRESTREAGLATNHGSTTMALGDVDGDGDLDLYVANYGEMSYIRSAGRAEVRQVNGKWVFTGPMANRLSLVNGRIEEIGEPDVLFLNDGQGRFLALPWTGDNFLDEQGQPKAAPADYGLTAQIRDINGDGLPDIYVCNDFQTPDRLWLNENRQRFRLAPRRALRHESFSAMSVDFADLDRDGFLDFFVTEMWPREHRVRQRQVTGAAPVFPMPGQFDNRPDVVRNTLFRGWGDGMYAEIAHFSGVEASDWSWSQAFLDVDLDGYEDLLVINGMLQDVQDRDTAARIRGLGRQSVEESRRNLLLYPPFLSPNVAWRNRGDLTFADRGAEWGFAATNISTGLVLADLDNDGDQDVVLNTLQGAPLFYRNEATAARIAVRLRGPKGNFQGIGAKVRLRGGPVPEQTQEIVCGGRYLGGDDPTRTFAAAPATGPLVIEVDWPDGRRSVVENARPNCIYEIDHAEARAPAPHPPSPEKPAWFEDVSGALAHTHHEQVFDDYAQQPLLHRQFSSGGPGLAWTDLDGDGWEDLLAGSGKGGRLAALRNQQGRGLSPLAEAPVNAPVIRDLTTLLPVPGAAGAAAILAGSANYEDGVKAGSVARTYDLAAKAMRDELAAPTASTGPMAMADYDADGDLDLFVGGQVIVGRYPEPADSLLFQRVETGWQLDAANSGLLKQVGLVNGAVWTDLTGDGFPELVLACEWGPIRILRNQAGTLAPWNAGLTGTSPETPRNLDALTGWWTGLSAGDFNGDGRLDLVAGNWGRNTGYQASPQHALRLHFGDVLEQGTMDLIETCWVPEMGAYAPIRSLSALSRAFPVLNAAFPNHHAFSEATIDQVLAALPGQTRVVEAATLDSVVLLNEEAGFRLVPLPSEAQWAPVFGISVADFDGDGAEDLFLNQNFYAVRPEWPRTDAGRGLLLKGDGKGGFTPVRGQDSGIRLYGEGRGAAVADFDHDGRTDLAVGQNGSTTHLLHNRRAEPGLRVRLDAGPANPWGIGAVVRVQTGDDLGAAREIRLGGGWWSADSPVTVIAKPAAGATLQVRWPGGAVSEHAVGTAAKQVMIRREES